MPSPPPSGRIALVARSIVAVAHVGRLIRTGHGRDDDVSATAATTTVSRGCSRRRGSARSPVPRGCGS
jgi:hypothetical protein